MDGRKGWAIAGLAFASNAILFGIVFSFGTFFGPMAEEFGSGHGATALAFSITSATYFFAGAITGPLSDRIGPRRLVLLGAALATTGLLVSAWAPSLWVTYLSFGVLFGLGAGCVHVPMLATVGGWFERYRAPAMAFAIAGNGAGALIINPAAAALIDAHGFRAVYAMFAVAAALIVGATALAVRRAPASAKGCATCTSYIDSVRETVARPMFPRLYAAAVLSTLALFVPFVFLGPYAEDNGVSSMHAATIVAGMAAASVAGRVLFGMIASRHDVMTLYRGCLLATALTFGIWFAAQGDVLVLWAFAMLFGLAYGGSVGLIGAVVARLFGVQQLGSALGLILTAGGVGSLIGPPVSGAIIDATGYTTAIAVSATLSFAAWVASRAIVPEESALPPQRATIPAATNPA